MRVTDRPLADFVGLIQRGEPFALSRWGDGEWQSIFGQVRGTDAHGHAYFPQLAVDLALVLESRPSYLLALPREVDALYGDNVVSWLARRRLTDLDWVAGDVFRDASRAGRLGPLVDALNAAPALVLVGPPHLAKLKGPLLDYDEFVTVPPRNAYLAFKGVLRDTLAASESRPDGTVIAVSAGMPAKLLVHELHRRLGRRHQIIDFGSLWDYHVGAGANGHRRRARRPS